MFLHLSSVCATILQEGKSVLKTKAKFPIPPTWSVNESGCRSYPHRIYNKQMLVTKTFHPLVIIDMKKASLLKWYLNDLQNLHKSPGP